MKSVALLPKSEEDDLLFRVIPIYTLATGPFPSYAVDNGRYWMGAKSSSEMVKLHILSDRDCILMTGYYCINASPSYLLLCQTGCSVLSCQIYQMLLVKVSL